MKDAHYEVDVAHMNRALTDARHLGRAAEDLARRAETLSDEWRETRRTNHVAEAVVESIRRRGRSS